MIKVSIVDDESRFLKAVHTIIENEFRNHNLECDYRVYRTPSEFIKDQKKNPCDIAFLDIMMPDITGFDIASEMRRLHDDAYIIFITSNEESVYDSFEFQPFQFIRKDCDRSFAEQLRHTVENLVRHLKQNYTMLVQMPFGEERKVRVLDIMAVKSDKNYLEVICSGEKNLRVRRKMAEMEEELRAFDFVRIHNRWLINMRYIKLPDYPNDEVVMMNGITLPLSRSKKNELQRRYAEYLRSL